MITVEDLTVELGDQQVLNGLSLSVADGAMVGLVGPNGAGKTTLLRTIDGYLPATAGHISIHGDAIEELSTAERGRQVGVVPQGETITFELAVETVVEMGRYPYLGRVGTPTPADRTAVETALQRTETAAFRDRSITDLSGGQRRRVLIARALAQEPSVLLLDEPTADLDINHQISILSLVRELAADGKSVMIAIHDLDLAARFCDRLVLLVDGTIQARGPPSAVLTADHLRAAFDIDVTVKTDPVTGTPSVTAHSGHRN